MGNIAAFTFLSGIRHVAASEWQTSADERSCQHVDDASSCSFANNFEREEQLPCNFTIELADTIGASEGGRGIPTRIRKGADPLPQAQS